MARVLCTGIAGFLGSHVAEHLRDAGHEVTGLDDLSGGFRENIPEGARFFRGSIVNSKDVDCVFRACKPEAVFHLAAYAAEGLSPFIRRHIYENIVIGSANVVNACVNHGVKLLVATSSIAVYGDQQPPFTEDMQPKPIDPYGIAKYAMELDIRAAHEQFGLDYVIFRPHNIYGTRQSMADKARNVVAIFMNQVLAGQPMTIFGNGTQTRAFSYVGDVAPIIAAAMNIEEARNQVFNVGADNFYSVNELACAVREALDDDAHSITYLPERNEAQHAFCDHEKARRVFANVLDHRHSLGAGLRQMAAWAKSRGPQTPAPLPPIEIERKLPEVWK